MREKKIAGDTCDRKQRERERESERECYLLRHLYGMSVRSLFVFCDFSLRGAEVSASQQKREDILVVECR